jgi:hypothetical protein
MLTVQEELFSRLKSGREARGKLEKIIKVWNSYFKETTNTLELLKGMRDILSEKG